MLPYLWCEQLSEAYCDANACVLTNGTCLPCDNCESYDTEWLVPLVPFSLVVVCTLIFGVKASRYDVHPEVWWAWTLFMVTLTSLSICFYFVGSWISTLLINLLLALPLVSFFVSRIIKHRQVISRYHWVLILVLLAMLLAECISYGFHLKVGYWKSLVWMYTTLTLLYTVWLDVQEEGYYSMFLLVAIIQYIILSSISITSEGNAQYLWLFPACLFSLIPLLVDFFTDYEHPLVALSSSGVLVCLAICTLFLPDIWVWFGCWYFFTIGFLALHMLSTAWPSLKQYVEYSIYSTL